MELFTAYVDSGGDKLSHRTLVQRLQDMFGDDLAHQVLAKKRALETDFGFLQNVVTHKDIPEFHGYNTKVTR